MKGGRGFLAPKSRHVWLGFQTLGWAGYSERLGSLGLVGGLLRTWEREKESAPSPGRFMCVRTRMQTHEYVRLHGLVKRGKDLGRGAE